MLPEEINEKTTVAELAAEIAEHPNLWGMHSIEDAINKILSFRPTPSTPQGEVEQAAKEWVENHDDAFVRGQFGTHYRAFLAGASWQSLSSESSGAVELDADLKKFCDENDYTNKPLLTVMPMITEYIESKFHLTRKQ